MHFGMNGSLKLVSEGEPDPSYARLQLHFEKGDRLVYVNPRRLGRISLPENAEAFIAEAALGPDVLDAAFNSHAFVAILASSKRTCRRSSPSAGPVLDNAVAEFRAVGRIPLRRPGVDEETCRGRHSRLQGSGILRRVDGCLTSTRGRTTLKIAQTLRADHGRITSDSSASRFIQSLNQPRRLVKIVSRGNARRTPEIWG